MNVRDSVSRAPLRFAAVRSSCRADGRAPGQIGKAVDVVGRFSRACAYRGPGLHPESAELNAEGFKISL